LIFSISHFYSLAVWAVIGGITGSRLLYVLTDISSYIAQPQYIIGFENLGASGVIAGGMAAIALYALITRISFWQSTDILAIGAVAGIGLSAIGCLLSGCSHGTETLLWAVIYTNEASLAPLNVPLHPVQFYFVLWCLLVTAILCIIRRRLPVYGTLALLAIFLCLSGDFILYFIREGSAVVAGFQWGQMLSLLIAAVSLTLFVIKVKKIV
jgi:phosphatidylglycerol:prolipoprotein diacylglycerol transferase